MKKWLDGMLRDHPLLTGLLCLPLLPLLGIYFAARVVSSVARELIR